MADSKEGADPSQSSQPAFLSGFARAVNAVSSFVGPLLKATVGTIALGCMGYTVMNKISDFFTSATATEAGKTFTPKQVSLLMRELGMSGAIHDDISRVFSILDELQNGKRDVGGGEARKHSDDTAKASSDFDDAEEAHREGNSKENGGEKEGWGSRLRERKLKPGVHVGATIQKDFSGVLYSGSVESYNYKTSFYHVVYEDGDEEDLCKSDVESLLVNTSQKAMYHPPNAAEGVEQPAMASKGGVPDHSAKRMQAAAGVPDHSAKDQQVGQPSGDVAGTGGKEAADGATDEQVEHPAKDTSEPMGRVPDHSAKGMQADEQFEQRAKDTSEPAAGVPDHSAKDQQVGQPSGDVAGTGGKEAADGGDTPEKSEDGSKHAVVAPPDLPMKEQQADERVDQHTEKDTDHSMEERQEPIDTPVEPPKRGEQPKEDTVHHQAPGTQPQPIGTYVGRKIKKTFSCGVYSGLVASYDPESSLYHVVYDDSDEEDMYKADVETWLDKTFKADVSSNKRKLGIVTPQDAECQLPEHKKAKMVM